MFERYSSEPIYNTRAVVRRTGVPADTFRAWERRYGVPSPLRTSGNQRLYCEQDIRKISWLREQTAMGMTISQAIKLMRVQTHQKDVPSIAPSFEISRSPVDREYEAAFRGGPPVANDPLISARRQLVEALARLDGQAAENIFVEAFTWTDMDVVLIEVLHGALVEIRDRPDLRPPVSPALHFAQAFVRRKLFSLYNQSGPNDGRGPILSASVDGEYHDLTLLLSAYFLSRAGFRVVFLGPNLPFQALLSAMKTTRPIAVCLAATDESTAATLLEWNQRLTSLKDDSAFDYGSTPICYTGKIFVDQAELRTSINGHFLGNCAQDAVEVVEAIYAGLGQSGGAPAA